MKKNLPYLLLCLLFGCTSNKKNENFITTKSNFEYQIISVDPDADSVLAGDIVKVHLQQYIDDSLMNDTRGGLPEYIKIDSTLRSFDFSEILPFMKKNDSAICLFPTAEIIKRSNAATHPPHFLEEGRYIKVFLKIVDRFSVDSIALMDYQQEKMRFDSLQLVKEEAGFIKAELIFDSLIRAVKDPLKKLPAGVYVQLLQKGSGNPIKKGDSVSVVYKGVLADGKSFEETTVQHPYIFRVGQQETVAGFDQGISSLSFGDRARIFIPARLAYGTQQASDQIPPFSNLVFEVTVRKP